MSDWALHLAATAARILPGSLKRFIYRIRPLAGLIRGSLNRLAPHGLTVIEVAAGDLAGWHLKLDLQSEKDYWLGTYEPDLQAAIRELVKPGMVAYDVGANVGYISLLLARAVGPDGRVFAFEPLPENQERWQENIYLNDLAGRLQLTPAAVIDRTHQVSFFIGPSDDMGKAEGSAGRQTTQGSQSILVAGIALDDFVYADGHLAPQVVKIDVEGGEVLALPGMRRILNQARPLVLLELHGPQAAQVAWQELSAAGYQVSRMQAGFPVVTAPEGLDWKAYIVGAPLP